LVEIRETQSCFRPPDLSPVGSCSHVQPPPKRLNKRMSTRLGRGRYIGDPSRRGFWRCSLWFPYWLSLFFIWPATWPAAGQLFGEWALHSALPSPSFFSPRARSTTDCPVGISIQCRCGCPLCCSFGKLPWGVHRLPVRCMAQIGDLADFVEILDPRYECDPRRIHSGPSRQRVRIIGIRDF
jgi:hypothetical protein